MKYEAVRPLGRTAFSAHSPIMEAQSWMQGMSFSDDLPLLNVSQAAPMLAPPQDLRAHLADLLENSTDVHLYGPVLGQPELRDAVAQKWVRGTGAAVAQDNVAITPGCNQAFTAVMSTLAQQGDNIILPVPWYFNHKMWCDMMGIEARALPCEADLSPSLEQAEHLIDEKTRAIVLITPNNPTGVEYPQSLIHSFLELARKYGIFLIIDETYFDFRASEGRAYDLSSFEAWPDNLISLYSFSKSYRLTGHRVGAMIAPPDVVTEAAKFLDTTTICPTALGQAAALYGMQNLDAWLEGERQEILARAATVKSAFTPLIDQGWRLLGCGGFFAYVTYPYDVDATEFAKYLLQEHAILALPGTMFLPQDETQNIRSLRIAFANIDVQGIENLAERLLKVRLPLAPLS
jgi:aspartate/methionine/tyrosine aminotransferase